MHFKAFFKQAYGTDLRHSGSRPESGTGQAPRLSGIQKRNRIIVSCRMTTGENRPMSPGLNCWKYPPTWAKPLLQYFRVGKIGHDGK